MTTPLIAVFTKNRTNPAYAGARLAADRTAARLGVRTRHYVPERPDDVAEQIALIDRAIGERPDAAVFVPVHDTAVNASILKLNAAGVPLCNFINRTTAGERVTFVGSDDHALAVAIARRLCERLGGRGEIVVLEGTPASPTSRERLRGFRDALAGYGGIRVAASVRGDYQRDVAAAAMARTLEQVARIDGVLAANDTMALGALDALAGARIAPLVVGVNAIPEAIAAIKAGRMLATADFDAFKMSCIATEAAVRHMRGEPVPAEIILPVQLVDAGNCAPWDRPLEARECPRWEDVVAA
jgi:ribose transport system substrate-binding protein